MDGQIMSSVTHINDAESQVRQIFLELTSLKTRAL
jgi:hypothetical protein